LVEINEAGFAALTGKITRDRGFRCASYKDKCLRRRIVSRMRAKSAYTFAEYAAMLDADPPEYERLMRALTINVTKFFRNWETWNTLAKKVIPELWALPAETLCIWSAGCSSGEEAYSTAVLFHEHAELLGELGRLGRVKILGTDIDEECLEAARRGLFAETSFAETPAALREKYFPQAGALRAVVPEVRRLVAFARGDLLQDPPSGRDFHMILCRNVIIYFERHAQDELFVQFRSCLGSGGTLVLGKVETLLGAAREWFKPVSSRERIFRKL
jgi:chemotaxis protein methyltransferase CheR